MNEKPKWYFVDEDRRLELLCLNGVEHFIAHNELGRPVAAYCVVRPRPAVPFVGGNALDHAAEAVAHVYGKSWHNLPTEDRVHCKKMAREVLRAAGVTVDECQP